MGKAKSVFLRLIRVTVATAAGAVVARYADDPRFVFLAPFVSAAGKAARQKFPELAPYIPF